jgi:hypothetical protein
MRRAGERSIACEIATVSRAPNGGDAPVTGDD